MERRKELKLAYKETPRPMGVYVIRNTLSGKLLVGASMNLTAAFNAQGFQLRMNCHRCKELQQDWGRCGGDAFAFEVLEQIDAAKVPREEWREAVAALEDKWLTKLQPYGDKGYNARKKAKAPSTR